MKIPKRDQSYTVIDIVVDEFDDELITKVMRIHPALASARIKTTKFSEDVNGSILKFYVHHRLFDNKDGIIEVIEEIFKNNKISKKVKE